MSEFLIDMPGESTFKKEAQKLHGKFQEYRGMYTSCGRDSARSRLKAGTLRSSNALGVAVSLGVSVIPTADPQMPDTVNLTEA